MVSLWVYRYVYYPQCGKTKKFLSLKNISWKQLFSNFFSKMLLSRNFSQKSVGVSFCDSHTVHNYFLTLWNFDNFLATLILREINFGWFQKVKNCHFNNFKDFEFWLLEISHLKISKTSILSKISAAQMVKISICRASKWPNLISCKIWVAEKFWYLHTVFFFSFFFDCLKIPSN